MTADAPPVDTPPVVRSMLFSGGASRPAPEQARLLALAIAEHRKGNQAKAMALYKHVLQQDPTDPDANHLLGLLCHQLGQNQLASTLIMRAVGQNPREAVYYVNLGNVLHALGKYRSAAIALHKAVALSPDLPEAHYNLGNALFALRRLQGAVEAFRNTLNLDPRNLDARYNLGVALLWWGRYDEAVEALQLLAERRPRSPEVRHNLAIALQRTGASDDAEDAFRAALHIDPSVKEVWLNLGNLLHDQGRSDEAAATLREVLVRHPDYGEAAFNLGNVLKRLGRIGEAAEAYRRAIDLDPKRADAHYNLHACLFDDRDLAPARACLDAALSVAPHHLALFYRGVIQHLQGEVEVAAATHVQVREAAPRLGFLLDSWEYAVGHAGPQTRFLAENTATLRFALDQARVAGLVLEFGVSHGYSTRCIAEHAGQDIHAFDSFEGLPEAWGSNLAGTYSTGGTPPPLPGNVRLHQGWFDDTLGPFAAEHPGPVRFMNVDCDLYSSTRTVFERIGDRVVAGTVIVFDEYLGNAEWREHEFKAFQEFVATARLTYTYLALNPFTKQAVVRIDERPSEKAPTAREQVTGK